MDFKNMFERNKIVNGKQDTLFNTELMMPFSEIK